MGPRRRLSDVAGDELGAVGLDEVALRHEAEGAPRIWLSQPRHGGLAGSRVAGEHQVVARPRAWAACAPRAGPWMRRSDVSRRTSVLTLRSPTRPSSSARSSSIVAAAAARSPAQGRRQRSLSPLPVRRGARRVGECRRDCHVPGGGGQRGRTRRGGRRGSGRWPRSRRATARGRRTPRRGRAARRARSSARHVARVLPSSHRERRRRGAGWPACSAARATRPCPSTAVRRAVGPS